MKNGIFFFAKRLRQIYIFEIPCNWLSVIGTLKLANVVPVYKKGSQTSLSNYRPISLLSIFNKLLERLMYNRMIKFLEKNDIFYTKQLLSDQNIVQIMQFFV